MKRKVGEAEQGNRGEKEGGGGRREEGYNSSISTVSVGDESGRTLLT